MIKDSVFLAKLDDLHQLRSVKARPAEALALSASTRERNRMHAETARRVAVLKGLEAYEGAGREKA